MPLRLDALDAVLPSGGVRLLADGNNGLTVPRPARLFFLDGSSTEAGYDSVVAHGEGLECSAVMRPRLGGTYRLVDRWAPMDDGLIQVTRELVVEQPGVGGGLRLELHASTARTPVRGFEDWNLFIPGALYKKNDTDGDGKEDYLGTYVQDFRDDRLASMSVGAYSVSAGSMYGLARVDQVRDEELSAAQLGARFFVSGTKVGSLGLAPIADGQIRLRASFPFVEERTWCLNIDGDGWAAFAPDEAAAVYTVSYVLSCARADSFTDAIWQLTLQQESLLGTKQPHAPLDLAGQLRARQSLTQKYYREWQIPEHGEAQDAPAAGFMVHFSPRTGRTLGQLLEYGFSGAQTLLAWASLHAGHQDDNAEYLRRGRAVIDFFVQHCQLDNGFSHAMYDARDRRFVYWFTGILYPFQHSKDIEELRGSLGERLVDALMPIADQLRDIEGNYMRTMCESMYPILLACELELSQGNQHQAWLDAGERFGRFLLTTQQQDGSWFRAYSIDGTPLTRPHEWFGVSEVETKSGTIFPVPVLLALWRLTKHQQYLHAAVKAGDFILGSQVYPVEYVGGLNDTTHIKAVKTDAVGVMFVMRSLAHLHEATGERRFLHGARDAARILSSWIYLHDVDLPKGTLLESAGFRSTGWVGCDVLPAGSYLDNEMLEFTGDLLAVAVESGDEALFRFAEMTAHALQQGMSTKEDMLGYAEAGIQCEGLLTSYWLSEPDDLAFSGAVAKVKGDDNDTCNGLINGQALYGWVDIERRFGTRDFALLRQRHFNSTAQ